MKTSLILVLFILAACFEDNRTPEAALKDFIEMRMGKVVTKDAIIGRVTGKMKESLENITDEEFQQFADLRNFERESFKILSKSCETTRCFVTYTLSYKTSEAEKQTFTTDVKKIAEIHQVDGKWLISDVSNIKTYHEASEPINAMDDKAQ